MITIHRSIDQGAQTITWKLEEAEPPESEKHGRLCHAFDGSVLDDQLRHVMRTLGYIIVCAEEKPFPAWGFTEYWARAS